MYNILELTLEHIFLVMMALFLAIIIAVPLAIIIYKKGFYIEIVLNIVSLFQAFPSLAIFAILVPFVGIGMKVAIITLFLYAIMPIFISTIQGFKAINPDYYTIIESLNISKQDVFFKIELPLVLPFIINGIRLTTIYTISLATIATLVGAGGLGDLIYLGLQTLDLKVTFMGIIPLLILTILCNIMFSYIEKKLLPADQKFKQGIDIR